MRLRALSLLCLSVLISGACGKKDEATPPKVEEPVVACDASKLVAGYHEVAAADIGVYLDVADPHADILAGDVEAQLRTLWGAARVERAAPAGKPWSIWISTSAAAKEKIGATLTSGYAIKRVEQTIVVYAATTAELAHGAYALLETFGLRFFHPKQTFVPKLAGPRIPKTLDVTRQAAFATRGVQLHTLHPIEWLPALHQPGEANLADAKLLIDWLVRTGQNHLQWFLLETIPLDEWRPHATKIVEYAHLRGVTVGAVAQLFGGASLQSGFALVKDKVNWQPEMVTKLEQLLVVPYDLVELGMGEFFASDPEGIVAWLDHGTKYLADKHPKVTFSVVNHVGNYPNLYLADFRGEKNVFFYHLPKFADPRLMNNVHTVFFFDLYRDWGGYGHPNFTLHRDYIFDQLPKRKMRYFPESAYWASADVDVPVFLPEYVRSRWNDIHGLTADIKAKGLPALDGHITFSSGHEWGYWLTDYLTSKMAWEPEKPLEYFVEMYTSIFGDCSVDASTAFRGFMDVQRDYLFDKKLAGYVSGEDSHDDFGFLSNITTTPTRVPFEALIKMDEAARTTFEKDVVSALDEAATKIDPHAAAIAARCRGADAALKPWCDELRDGMDVVALRLRHAAHLYRAVLAHVRKQDSAPHVKAAKELTAKAKVVIDGRAKGYRFPVEALIAKGKTPTIYPFKYLAQAHTQCFWVRREEQVAWIVENDEPPPYERMSSCQE